MYDNPIFNALIELQTPPYANIDDKEYPPEYYQNPYTQNFENFLVNVQIGHQFEPKPLLNGSLWDIRYDEYLSPCLDIYRMVETRSGKLNGIKILVDLETYDNGDVR